MKTDSNLRDDVLSEIKWRPNIDATHIGVTAKDGVVTLTGRVNHFAQRSSLVAAAESVRGVRAIANDIEVSILDLHKRDDADIAAAVVNALEWHIEVPNDNITVVVEHGWVTLHGKVDWHFEKKATQRCVEKLMGVTGVTNSISITPAVKWFDVKSKIEDAFERNADVEALRINVSTDKNTVILSGSVASATQRHKAFSAAWSAPGVKSVINNITIEGE